MNQSVSTMAGKTKVKIVFLGNQSVGKSSVIQKYVHNRFDESAHPTIGIDFLAKNITHKNKIYRLQLWDTAGQQRFRSLIPSYLKDAQCALILFDVTNKSTLQNAQSWLKMYNQNKTGTGFTFLIGNKIDLIRDRQVSVEQGQKHAQQLGIPYFQISAKTSQNVQTLFLNLLDVCSNNSLDITKFSIQKHIETDRIDEAEQKNEDDKDNKGKKTQQEKKQTKQPQNRTIKLQNRKQTPKIQQKSCC